MMIHASTTSPRPDPTQPSMFRFHEETGAQRVCMRASRARLLVVGLVRAAAVVHLRTPRARTGAHRAFAAPPAGRRRPAQATPPPAPSAEDHTQAVVSAEDHTQAVILG